MGRASVALAREASNGRSADYCRQARTHLECAKDNYLELQRHL